MLLSLVLAAIGLLLIYLALRRKRYNLPPGPSRYPFVGNLPMMLNGKRDVHLFRELAEQYGKIVYLSLGPYVKMVILNDPEFVREAFNHQDLISRPDIYIAEILFENKGIIMQRDLNIWTPLRRFALHALRDFGIGKEVTEERIREEARCLMAEIDRNVNNGLNWHLTLEKAVTNVMCSVLFGERYEYNDAAFAYILSRIISICESSSLQMPENLIPFLRHIRPEAKKIFGDLRQTNSEIKSFVGHKLEEHKTTYDENNIQDFLHLYMKISSQEPENKAFTEPQIFRTMIDLFLAGSDTTATTLRWVFLYMLHNPDAQQRARQEIDSVIGNREPCFSDKESLPYVEAVIQETQRLANVVPVGVAHSATEDVRFHGYDIPKGTMVFANLSFIHTDQAYWEKPYTFMPERWLDENGSLKKSQRFMPFSAGKRVCLGETLARMELFLFTTMLLQSYEFKPSVHLPSTEPIPTGTMLQPNEYSFKAVRL